MVSWSGVATHTGYTLGQLVQRLVLPVVLRSRIVGRRGYWKRLCTQGEYRHGIQAASRYVSYCFTLMISLAAATGFATDSKPATAPSASVQAFDLRDVRLLDGQFKAAMDRNAQYLLSLEPDRFLHYFRTQRDCRQRLPRMAAGSRPGRRGPVLGHYLSALSLQFRASGDDRFKQRIDYIVDELATIQSANGNGYLCAEEDGKQFWAELAAGDGEA